jgi:hypothetical protein
MSDALVEAAADRIGPDAVTFASLPLLLAHRIFLALPVDARGRASCVCRAWRDALDDPSLWTRLDMSAVLVEEDEAERFLAVFLGAVGRARGQLCHLQLSQQYVGLNVLQPVLTANAGSLRELHLGFIRARSNGRVHDDVPSIESAMAAAPQLQVLTTENVACKWEDAPRMLRAEALFALLQMRRNLSVGFTHEDYPAVGGMERVGQFAAALADATLQPALSHVCVLDADTAQPALMGALVDAALARRLPELMFLNCTPPAAAPLARLLAGNSLVTLHFNPFRWPFLEAADTALVAGALRVNTSLTKLVLGNAGLYIDNGVILGALVGHPSLCELRIFGENTTVERRATFGAAFAALIAADAPALHFFVCFNNSLGDAGLAPIVEALALNHHLRELHLSGNGMSEAFARERLLPAVRANTTLWDLRCADQDDEPVPPAAAEADELVRLRGQHD